MIRLRVTAFLVSLSALVAFAPTPAFAGKGRSSNKPKKAQFSAQYFPTECEFASVGANSFFILEPGYRLVLEGDDEQVIITVLDETEVVDGVLTRVVEEREFEDGELSEVSRNYFALCTQTGDVYYFGEDVDDYEGGQVVGHEGAWRAGIDEARAGILMPGSPLLGSRYYQEIAPGVALDRAEHLAFLDDFEVEAGEFHDVLFVLETSGLDRKDESLKHYAPGVGLIKDDDVELIEYGFVEDRR